METATRRLAVCTTVSIATEGRTIMRRGGMSGHGTEGASLGKVHGWYSSPTITKMSQLKQNEIGRICSMPRKNYWEIQSVDGKR